MKISFVYKMVIISWFPWNAAAQMTCPIPWWYCLNRDPRENSQIYAVDTSNRSIIWNWDSGGGRWYVKYHHSFSTGAFGIYASYIKYDENNPAFVSYNSDTSWNSNGRLIASRPWDMAYNGDVFGFEPGNNGQYTFHIHSRKLRYNPFMNIPTAVPTVPVSVPFRGRCSTMAKQRAEGSFWWLDRKNSGRCPVTVSSSIKESPLEWEWETDTGRWRISYSWSTDVTNCSIFYTHESSWSQKMQIVTWSYVTDQLTVTYASIATRISDEKEWKMHVNGGETWGFTPDNYEQWTIHIYSRNVIIKPFEKSTGMVSLV